MENKYSLSYFLNHIDIPALQKRIYRYFMTNTNNMSYSEIWTNLIFTIVDSENDYTVNFHPTANVLKDTTLYRARKINGLDKIPELKYETSYWEKPIKYATDYGRINCPKENPLYLANDIATCLYEIDASEDEFVLVSSFQVLRTITLNSLLFEMNTITQKNYLRSHHIRLNKNGREAFKIFSEFYSYLFNLPGGDNDTGYMQSNSVAKMFYSNGSNTSSDGWVYESHKVREIGLRSNNVCLTTESAHINLNLKSSIILKIKSLNDNKSISVQKMALRQPNSDQYIYSDNSLFDSKVNQYFGTQL